MALVALFAAIGLITATGAFTTVEAERTATVDVAGDASGLLGIDAADDSPGDVVEDDDSGVATIDLDEALNTEDGATGINPNANTTTSPLVKLTNQGTEDNIQIEVNVVETDPSDVDVYVVDSEGEITTNLDTIDAGSSVEFGLLFDLQTNGVGQNAADNFDVTIEISANQVDE